MEKKKEPSPISVVWGWAEKYHSKFYGSVVLAVLGVAGTMAAYFSIAAMIRILLENGDFSQCLPWCGLLLIGYLVKSVGSAWSTSMSHTATYYTLRDIRKKMLAKLSRVPMGTILDTPSGQYKTTIVDRVEGMEPTLAHLIPEMTANLLVPVAIAVYIFALDWRMGFASLVTTVIGMAIMSQSGKTYAVRWEGAVAVGKRMANAIIEYVGGIQVVKAFSQSAGSYKKYSGAVEENAQYYVDWMHDNQKYMSTMQTWTPSVLITVLPVGLLLWSHGSLSASDFFTIIVLSMGFAGPFLAALSFVDELAVVGANVKEINGILDSPELNRPEGKTSLSDESLFSLRNICRMRNYLVQSTGDEFLKYGRFYECVVIKNENGTRSLLDRQVKNHLGNQLCDDCGVFAARKSDDPRIGMRLNIFVANLLFAAGDHLHRFWAGHAHCISLIKG